MKKYERYRFNLDKADTELRSDRGRYKETRNINIFINLFSKSTLMELSIAIPASLISDVPHLREKTNRIGMIGRALAIFRVDEVIIYLDRTNENQQHDAELISTILSYMETPQYLRKRLFPIMSSLKYASVLPPLRDTSMFDNTHPKISLYIDTSPDFPIKREVLAMPKQYGFMFFSRLVLIGPSQLIVVIKHMSLCKSIPE